MPLACRLMINVDHSATLRNAREGTFPSPIDVARCAVAAGASGTTVHLREDRRHIRDADLAAMAKADDIGLLCMEMALTEEMVNIAQRTKPDWVCLVPEKRSELTTEGGLSISAMGENLAHATEVLHRAGIRVSVFVDAEIAAIEEAANRNVDAVEIHTGPWADSFTHSESEGDESILSTITSSAAHAHALGMEVHAGHGLTFSSLGPIVALKEVSEVSIGHFVICQALFDGLETTVSKLLRAIEEPRRRTAPPGNP